MLKLKESDILKTIERYKILRDSSLTPTKKQVTPQISSSTDLISIVSQLFLDYLRAINNSLYNAFTKRTGAYRVVLKLVLVEKVYLLL